MNLFWPILLLIICVNLSQCVASDKNYRNTFNIGMLVLLNAVGKQCNFVKQDFMINEVLAAFNIQLIRSLYSSINYICRISH